MWTKFVDDCDKIDMHRFKNTINSNQVYKVLELDWGEIEEHYQGFGLSDEFVANWEKARGNWSYWVADACEADTYADAAASLYKARLLEKSTLGSVDLTYKAAKILNVEIPLKIEQ